MSLDSFKCCPIDNTFKIIGKKFTMHIIRNMAMKEHSRFNQFLDHIEEINPKTLSARLKEMEKAGLISREVYDEIPIRVEYHLTNKGKDLQGILLQMAAFSMKHYPKQVFKDGKARTVKQVFNISSPKLK
ncbi:winged helix-turn-helix transcriptional regulator [Nitrosopumilus adriaticus]|uniref:winged helix-turn-helix transcriptional regulator n=1 Tax=Nitrosopumilus adriaticus TaxID=1580092 RepID=UPI00352EF7DA